MNPEDIGDIVRIAVTLGSVLLTIGVCAIVLKMIWPKRGKAAGREADPAEAEEMWRTVDVMEARLDVLERALADQVEGPRANRIERDRERDFLLAKDGRDTGRTE